MGWLAWFLLEVALLVAVIFHYQGPAYGLRVVRGGSEVFRFYGLGFSGFEDLG